MMKGRMIPITLPHMSASRFLATFRLSTLLLATAAPVVGAQAGNQSITKLRITPGILAVAVGDSLRLRVEALDARGNVVPGAAIRFTAQGGRFQGSIDSLGVV